MTHSDHPRPVRVTVAHESELVVHGLSRLLADHADRVTLVPAQPDGSPAPFVDLTLHDTLGDLPGSLTAVEALLARPVGGRLVTFTWNVRPDLVRRALDLGVSGCLTKDLPARRLVAALEAIHAGRRVVEPRKLAPSGRVDEALTPREAEVVSLITRGLDNHTVAQETYLSINSVKSHIRSAYRKMGVTSRSQAVLWGVRHGYGDPVLGQEPGATHALTG